MDTCELDSHADTILAGSNCKIETTTYQTVRVKPFSDDMGTIEKVIICSVRTVYVHPSSGELFVLRFNEALIFGDRRKSSLINPNQIKVHDATVSDFPRKVDRTSSHSIVGVDDRKGQAVRLPICLRGVISYLPTSFPTDD